ncbi:hypothetical protein A4A49_36213 [Nicotiana attenuata]|uniref:Uncharacterized protein n=1 Tax=Nicotiana attenuata TaxID=49451 RepID=A0A314KP09_NICAT|nr:hypothetical protein A4A49_36213 [Nicotiana attenuata]
MHCHFTCDEALLVPRVERDQLVPCEIAEFPFTEILCVKSKKPLAAPALPSEMQPDLEDRKSEEVQVFYEMSNSRCPTVYAKAQSDAPVEMITEEATCPKSSKVQLFAESPQRAIPVKYVTAPSLDHVQRQIEFEIFEDMYLAKFLMEPAIIEDLCLDKLFMENEDVIPRTNLSVWDPELSSKFMALTSSTKKEEAHTLFEDLRKRACLFAKLYDWQPVGGVPMAIECSCYFQNSCTSYNLLGESIAHSFLYSFDGAPSHLEEQYMLTQFRYFRSGLMWCHCEIAYLVVVMHWLLIELIHYEEDITCYSPVYKILMMLSCGVGVPASTVLTLHQPSKVLAMLADKEGWKSKVQANFLKLDKGLHYFNLMEESKLEHDNAQYVIIVDMLGRSSQLVHAGNYIYDTIEFMDMDLLDVGLNMKPFRGLAKLGFQTDSGLFGHVSASQRFNLYPYVPGIQVLPPNTYGHVCRKGVVANVLLGGSCTYYSVELLPRPKLLSAAAADIVEAPEDAGWMTSDHRYMDKRVQHSFNHFIPSVRWFDLFSMAIISVRKQKFRGMPFPMLTLGMEKGVVHFEIRLICVALSCAFICTDAGVISQYVMLVVDALLGTLRYDIRYKVEDPFDWMKLISLQDDNLGTSLHISGWLSLMADGYSHYHITMSHTRGKEVTLNCLFGVDSVKRILLQFLLYSNLADKVLSEAGGIVVNSVSDSVEDIFGNLENYVWDPF